MITAAEQREQREQRARDEVESVYRWVNSMTDDEIARRLQDAYNAERKSS